MPAILVRIRHIHGDFWRIGLRQRARLSRHAVVAGQIGKRIRLEKAAPDVATQPRAVPRQSSAEDEMKPTGVETSEGVTLRNPVCRVGAVSGGGKSSSAAGRDFFR